MEHYATRTALYESIARQLESLFDGESSFLANTANMAALVFDRAPDLNWAGFYFLQDDQLVLGPFQGRPACVRIPVGKGVCGTAAASRESLVVHNVHKFDGHIACDAASNAELVVPIVEGDRVIGVFDLDSPTVGRFGEEDRIGIEELVRIWQRHTDLSPLRMTAEGI